MIARKSVVVQASRLPSGLQARRLHHKEIPTHPHAIRSSRSSSGRMRPGFILAELAMSAAMFMIAMFLIVKVMGWVAAERRGAERREWAVQEASNLLETFTARPFESVTPEAAAKVVLSSQAQGILPGAELKAEVVADGTAGGPGSKRVSMVLRWRDRSGGWAAPVRLITWLYAGRPRA